MDRRVIELMVVKEVRDSLRTRWFLAYVGALTVLVTGLAAFTLTGSPVEGVMTRAAAGLINLVLLVVPLLGLMAGALTVVTERERGTLSYFLAQPLSRKEVFVSKIAGLALLSLSSVLISFGSAGAALAIMGSGIGERGFVAIALLTVVLSFVSASIGYLISVSSRRVATALGAGVLVWFVLAFLGDLGLMGTAMVMKLGIRPVFFLSLFNPLQLFKVVAVASVSSNLEALGPVGAYATDTLGGYLEPVFVGILCVWAVVVVRIAWGVFQKGEYVE